MHAITYDIYSSRIYNPIKFFTGSSSEGAEAPQLFYSILQDPQEVIIVQQSPCICIEICSDFTWHQI